MTAPDRLPRCPDCGLLGHQHRPEDPCGAPPMPRPRLPEPEPEAPAKPVSSLAARCSAYVILCRYLPKLRASEVLLRVVDGSTAYVTTTTPHARRWRVDLRAGTAVEVLR